MQQSPYGRQGLRQSLSDPLQTTPANPCSSLLGKQTIFLFLKPLTEFWGFSVIAAYRVLIQAKAYALSAKSVISFLHLNFLLQGDSLFHQAFFPPSMPVFLKGWY